MVKKAKKPKKKTYKKPLLNPNQDRFWREYLIDKNATKAAERAGYSKKTAYSQGQRLLKNVEIKKRLREAFQKIENKLEITAERIRDELGIIAFKTDADLNKKKCPFQSRDKIKSLELLAKHKNMFEDDGKAGASSITIMNDIQVDGKPFILKVGKEPEEESHER